RLLDGLGLGHVLTGHRCILHDRELHRTIYSPGTRGFVGGVSESTGLTHLGAREYDPMTGRFISADPVGDLKDAQQINGYAYSSNNPVTFADADGKWLLSYLVRVYVAWVKYVAAQAHQTYRASSGTRASRNSSRSGIEPWGSGNYGSGGTSCSSTYPAYKPGCNTNVEPENPKAQGSFKDFLGGIGHSIVAGFEGMSNFSPVCWIEDCSGATKRYDELASEKGFDQDTKAWDAGDAAVDVVSFITGMFGLSKALGKSILKGNGGAKPNSSRGAAVQQNGARYEEFLVNRFGGTGGFKVDRRQFDGSYPRPGDRGVWYEAKAGKFWELVNTKPGKMESWKGITGDAKRVANDAGAEYRIVSEVELPDNIAAWLTKKNIEWDVIPR
ncbi:RHS repeat-associated core domain-containing protein, partial [Streptomyces zhihengii]